jgi:hypothetical protein
MKKLILLVAALSLLLGACGGTSAAETPPPLTGEDVEATAFAMAWTMAAQTQTAMPTATDTPVPPTLTPTITATFTPAITNTPLPTATKEKDECNKPLSGWEGKESKILVVNETKSTVVVSLFLYQSARGYCGYLSTTLTKKQSATFTVPIGFYSASVWTVAGEQPSFSHWLDLTGVLNPDKHTLYIRDNKLKFVTP